MFLISVFGLKQACETVPTKNCKMLRFEEDWVIKYFAKSRKMK